MNKIKNLIFFFVFFILLTTPAVMAEKTYDSQGDLILPNSEVFTGKLYSIGEPTENEGAYVVIDDMKFMVSDNTIYRNVSGNLVSLRSFKSNMYVEYYLLDNIITKLMEINPDPEEVMDSPDVAPEQSQDTKGMRLENGVWVN